jgi:hypothetical protein
MLVASHHTTRQKDENINLLEDYHSNLNRWENTCHLLNVHGFNDVTQAEIQVHTAKPSVPEPASVEVEHAIEKLKVIKHEVFLKFQQN